MKLGLTVKYAKVIASHYLGFPLYKPDLAAIVVSDKCNLRCRMCDFWKKKPENIDEMTKKDYRLLFTDLKNCGVKKLQFTGGEPLLRKDFLPILKIVKNLGLDAVIITNGTLIKHEDAEALIELSNKIYFSLDAPDPLSHDEVRGVAGTFAKAVSGIRLLAEAKKKSGNKPLLVISSIITPFNLHDPRDMLNLAKELGVDRVIYNPASSAKGYAALDNHFSENACLMHKYGEMINDIVGLMGNSGGMLGCNPLYLECSKEFLKGNKRYFLFSCYSGGYDGPHIDINGEVYPCCSWNMSIGNVKKKPFSHIWKSKEAQHARRMIKKMRCPVCHHHTRTFDYLIRAPFLIKGTNKLIRGYKNFYQNIKSA